MAAAEHTCSAPHCIDCGAHVVKPKRGPTARRCPECTRTFKASTAARSGAPRPARPGTIAGCRVCGTPTRTRAQAYCSDECKRIGQPRKFKRRPCPVCGTEFKPRREGSEFCSRECVNVRRREMAEAKRQRECEWCGAGFVMRNPSGRARAGMTDEGRFCSAKCMYSSRSAKAAAAAVQERIVFLLARRRECGTCGQVFTARILTQVYCAEACRPSAHYEPVRLAPRACKGCGAMFEPRNGYNTTFCSDACGKRHARKVLGNKARKRAKRYGAKYEPVNVLKVFERDGWRCGLCGRKTIKAKRGTCHPRAPELDHIVPISQGGEHSYRNVQCACRQCNGAKAAGAGGQLRLFG